MSMFKSPTPGQPWPSTDAIVTMHVSDGRMPLVSASASIIGGTESMFAHIEVDTASSRPTQAERHAGRFALIGSRRNVLAVLDELRHAVQSAPAPIAGTDPEGGEAR